MEVLITGLPKRSFANAALRDLEKQRQAFLPQTSRGTAGHFAAHRPATVLAQLAKEPAMGSWTVPGQKHQVE